MRIEIRAKVDCRLSAKRNDNAVRFFYVQNVLNVFRGQRLEIQSVRRVEVGGNRFGIVVDNDHFIAKLFQRPNAMYGRIVELDTLTDTDRTGTDNDDTFFGASIHERLCFVVFVRVERRIEIRRFCGEFRRAGIYHLIRHFLSVRDFLSAERRDVLIEIAKAFAFFVKLSRQLFACKAFFVSNQILELVQEPAVDFRDIEHFVYGNAFFKRRVNDENSFVRHFGKLCNKLFLRGMQEFFIIKRAGGNFRAAHRFHHCHFKGRTNRHNFARRLHSRTQLTLRVQEFIKRPLGHFYNEIVNRRLETSVGVARNVVYDFVKRVTERDFGRNLCNREARRLGRKCGRTAYTGIYFDNRIFKGIGI